MTNSVVYLSVLITSEGHVSIPPLYFLVNS